MPAGSFNVRLFLGGFLPEAIDKRCVSLLATVSDWPVDHISALKSFYIHKPGWCRVVMQTRSGTSKRTGDVMQASYVGKALVGGTHMRRRGLYGASGVEFKLGALLIAVRESRTGRNGCMGRRRSLVLFGSVSGVGE